MGRKSVLIDSADKLLMAPWRYMDIHGNSQSMGRFSNFIHQPETKILALTASAATLLNMGVKETLAVLLAAGLTLTAKGINNAIMARTARPNYLDSYPETPIRLSPQTKKLLEIERPKLGHVFWDSSKSAMAASIVGMAAQADSFLIAVTTGSLFAYDFTRNMAVRYRFDRLLKDEWNFLVGSAPREPAAQSVHLSLGAGAPAPAPVPVRS